MINYEELDPEIRHIVKALNEAGYETSDSGDGSKAETMECAMDFPHVAGFWPTLASNRESLEKEAGRIAELASATDGKPWKCEIGYDSASRLWGWITYPAEDAKACACEDDCEACAEEATELCDCCESAGSEEVQFLSDKELADAISLTEEKIEVDPDDPAFEIYLSALLELQELRHVAAMAVAARYELECALSFYALPESYAGVGFEFDRPCGDFADDFSDDHVDKDYPGLRPGKTARDTMCHVFEEFGVIERVE